MADLEADLEHGATSLVLPTTARPVALDTRTLVQRFGRSAIGFVVAGYLLIVLIGPLAALATEIAKIGLGTALTALTAENARAALQMTLVLTVLSVAINCVVGTLGAIAIVRHRFPGRRIVDALADLPLAVSPVMIGLAFILMFGRGGLFSALLVAADIKVVFAFTGLVLGTLFVSLPFTLREVAYVLEELGTSEEEAAATLGASPWQIFWRVTLPNIRFGLGYGLLMTLARSIGEFGAVLVLGGSISGHTQTATTFIHDAIEERDLASAYGMALVLGLTSSVLLLALEWAKRRKAKR